MSMLPKSWTIPRIADVVEINPRFDVENLADDTLTSFIPMKSVEEETGEFKPVGDRKVSEVRKGYTPFRDGDVLFAKVTPCMENGKAAVMKGLTNGMGFGSTEFFTLRPKNGLEANYLFHFILQSNFRREAARNMTGAVGLRRVPKSWLEEQTIPLPSPDEQRRIVAEIGKQFTRLDAGVGGLRRVQANLKRYRTAVLKAACEGKLVPTEAEVSRSQRSTKNFRPPCETGEQLLQRILAERRKNWTGKGKYKEPPFPSPSDSKRTELPVGWTDTYLQPLLNIDRSGMKTGPFGSLLKKHEHRAEGIPVLGIENISNLKFVPGNKIFIEPAKASELASYDVLAGEILISRSGTVGEVCSVPEGLGEARISCNLMRVSLRPDGILPNFFCILFNGSPSVLRQVSDLCKGSTRDFLNQHILHSIIFPLPPLAEQTRIVAEVERRLSVVEELESVVSANLQRAMRLRQSILQKAFTGKL